MVGAFPVDVVSPTAHNTQGFLLKCQVLAGKTEQTHCVPSYSNVGASVTSCGAGVYVRPLVKLDDVMGKPDYVQMA